jgi:hypothetical protein
MMRELEEGAEALGVERESDRAATEEHAWKGLAKMSLINNYFFSYFLLLCQRHSFPRSVLQGQAGFVSRHLVNASR